MSSSFRLGLLAFVALSSAAAAPACSSSNNVVAPPGGDGGGSSGGGDGGTVGACTSTLGTGMSCPMQTDITVATKISVPAAWPASLAVSAGTGNVLIWLLSKYSIDANGNITGKSQTCGNQTPAITLNATGAVAVGAPTPPPYPQVLINIPSTTWDALAMDTAALTGKMGGWPVGSSLSIDPSVNLSGLSPSSMYANPSVAWPAPNPNGSALPMTDISDDDHDNEPGITAVPASAAPYYVPKTAITGGDPTDKLYLSLRTQVSLCGAVGPSCTESSGAATVGLLNNHVVGCHVPASAGDSGTGRDCTPAEYGFIDSNTTVYCPGTISGTQCQIMAGTYKSVQLATEGGAATCADVLAALP